MSILTYMNTVTAFSDVEKSTQVSNDNYDYCVFHAVYSRTMNELHPKSTSVVFSYCSVHRQELIRSW